MFLKVSNVVRTVTQPRTLTEFLKASNVVIFLKVINLVRAFTYLQNIDNVSQGQ